MERFEAKDEGYRDDEAYRQRLIAEIEAMGFPSPNELKGVVAADLVRRYRATRETEKGR